MQKPAAVTVLQYWSAQMKRATQIKSATRASLTNGRQKMLSDKESHRRQVHSLCSALYHNSELQVDAEAAAFYFEFSVSAGSEPSRAGERQRSAL